MPAIVKLQGIIVDQLSNGLQTQFLQNLRESETPVAVYLVNGIRLQGKIEFFDNYIVAVRHTSTQLVYKHAISTIVPVTGEESTAEQEKKPKESLASLYVLSVLGQLIVKANERADPIDARSCGKRVKKLQHRNV